jgi:plasmid stabilization system protein ParE
VSLRVYRIEWAEVARRDLFGIVDHLAGRNPDAAAATLEMLQRKASR